MCFQFLQKCRGLGKKNLHIWISVGKILCTLPWPVCAWLCADSPLWQRTDLISRQTDCAPRGPSSTGECASFCHFALITHERERLSVRNLDTVRAWVRRSSSLILKQEDQTLPFCSLSGTRFLRAQIYFFQLLRQKSCLFQRSERGAAARALLHARAPISNGKRRSMDKVRNILRFLVTTTVRSQVLKKIPVGTSFSGLGLWGLICLRRINSTQRKNGTICFFELSKTTTLVFFSNKNHKNNYIPLNLFF